MVPKLGYADASCLRRMAFLANQKRSSGASDSSQALFTHTGEGTNLGKTYSVQYVAWFYIWTRLGGAGPVVALRSLQLEKALNWPTGIVSP